MKKRISFSGCFSTSSTGFLRRIFVLAAVVAVLWTNPRLIADNATSTSAPSSQQKVFDVKDYGAVADGKTVCTAAIQKAMDACSQAGGGIVKLGSGIYLSGHLNLRNNITLSLESGATLLGSRNMADYPSKSFIVGDGVNNITLLGPGTIDDQGVWPPKIPTKVSSFFWVPQRYFTHPDSNPGDLLLLFNCSGVKIRNLTLKNSYNWTCHLLGCSQVAIDHLTIRNPIQGPNTDGIDVDSCQDVQISNADIYTGDDAICLKNRSNKITYPHPCKNITITNCKLTSPTNAFKIGTETYGDFENIVFRDSVIQAGLPTDPLSIEAAKLIPSDIYGNGLGPEAGIAIESADGAHIHGVSIKNIVMHGARTPIFIRLNNRGLSPTENSEKLKNGTTPTGTIDDVSISDVTADGASCASSITGVPGHPVQNVTITNLQATYIGAGNSMLTLGTVREMETNYPGALNWGPLPAYALYLRHVEGVQFNNVTFRNAKPDTRTAIIADDVSGLKLEGVTLDPVTGANPVLILNNVLDSEIHGTIPQNTNIWTQVSGAKTNQITLVPNNPQNGRKTFEVIENAPVDAVTVRQ